MFGDAFVATALLDHLLHHAGVVQIEDTSYRLRQRADLLTPAHSPSQGGSPEAASRRRGRPPTAAARVRAGGRARVLRHAMATADRYPVGTMVCVQDPDMKQAWCMAANSGTATANQLTGHYGRRWGIERGLRDTKDLRSGMGVRSMHIKSPEPRDRLWLINTFAVVLLTLLGAAAEALGFDRMPKTNTAKRRVHSLFRQGPYALRSEPNDAGAQAAPADAALLSHAAGAAVVCRRFRPGLTNEWVVRVSLGFVEGLNNKIRVFQRRAYSLSDEEYLRLNVLSCKLPALCPSSTTPLDLLKTQSTNWMLTLHFLPGYAPELNPDELIRSHVKRTRVARAPPAVRRG